MIKKSAAVVAVGAALAMGSSTASAQQLGGAIAQKWWEIGSENSVVGKPVSNEIAIPGGGRISCFERGVITWHPRVGAGAIYGDILQASVFSEVCRRGNADHLSEFAAVLGYPAGDEHTSSGEYGCPPGHRVQSFLASDGSGGGGFCWNPADRQVKAVGPANQGF